jgi:PIF1-like helicase/Helitron helicase-like domain at N-terminus/OTU-like cysteine protease/Helicase
MARVKTRKQNKKLKLEKRIKRQSQNVLPEENTENCSQSCKETEKNELKKKDLILITIEKEINYLRKLCEEVQKEDNSKVTRSNKYYGGKEPLKEAQQKLRKKIRERESERMKGYRKDDNYKDRENDQRSQKRDDPDYKMKEAEKESQRRLDEEVRKRDSERKKENRKDDYYKDRENEQRSQKRDDPNYKMKEAEKESQRRLDEEVRKRESERKKRNREDNDCRETENQSKKVKRSNNIETETQKEKDRKIKQRSDAEKRKAEKKADRDRKAELRKNNLLKTREQDKNTLLRTPTLQNCAKLEFVNKIKNGPSRTCCCCVRLLFPHSVVEFKTDKYDDEFLEKIQNFDSKYICNTCFLNVKKGQIPKLAASNGFKFPELPQCIQNMSKLEERMTAPMLPFAQIRKLVPHALNGQVGQKGSVVHIECEIKEMTNVLPRKFDKLSVVQIQLKRHLEHRTNYMHETIRPAIICEALTYLKDTPLYVKNKIEVDESFFKCYDNSTDELDFIVDENDIITELIPERNCDSDDSFDSSDDDEVLLYNRNKDNNEIKTIAPGQGKAPQPWHMIDSIDELCFPKIFVGHNFDENKKLSYSNRAKLEAMHNDRRSCIPERILYMAKCKLEKSMMSEINICLRKKKSTDKITAGNIINANAIDQLIQHDDGFRVMKNVRSTPAYWEARKKELLAMIRQLGTPTIFLTLSAAEKQWPELLVILQECKNRNILTEREAIEMSDFAKTELIANDSVTCARYFDYKMKLLIKLLQSPDGPFGLHYVVDSYERVEFQLRGSPHEHCMLYLKNAPVYEEDNIETQQIVVDFIDTYITCHYDENDPFVDLQRHKHTQTCNKGSRNKGKCRFNYPIPVMPQTMILQPLSKEEKNEKMSNDLSEIRKLMQEFFKKETILAFEGILTKLKLTENDYIMAIRSSLSSTQIFLRRNSREVAINAYNKDILHLFQANMDIQFILNAYACASYIVNYISKMEAGMTKMLKDAANDLENGHTTLREKFRKLGNIFINANLMSAQEAAFHVMGLPLSKCSRASVFIPTASPEERTRMLKPQSEIRQMESESCDVFKQNMIDKYTVRPHNEEIDNLCLADFAANFTLKKTHVTDEELIEDDALPEDKNDFEMRSRQKSKILRFCNFNKIQDEDNYYREQILLYLPWRNEQLEISDRNCEEIYNLHESTIITNRQKYTKITYEELNEAMDNVKNNNQNIIDEEADDEIADRLPNDQEIDIFGQVGDEKPNAKGKIRFTAPKLISDQDIKELMTKLNEQQREFVMHVYHCFKNSLTPFQIFLSGSAGVGKSLVITTIYQLLTKYFNICIGGNQDTIKIVLCAFSGLAAFLIGGTTIHTAFALPIQQSGKVMPELSSDIANTIRVNMIDVKLIIIDEISMVGYKMLCQIDMRLRQIMGQRTLPFGGVSIITVGDFNQLPPVGQSPVYKIVKNPLDILAGNCLWTDFKFYELTQIMRQKDDLAFTTALNNLSRGEMTPNDIQLIKSRSNMDETFVPDHIVRLYTTNKMVDSYNNQKIENSPGTMHTSTAVDTVLGKKLSKERKEYLSNLQKTKSRKDMAGLDHIILLKTEIKYMITCNIDIEDGLVNGTRGILKLIEISPKTNKPITLWFEFESGRVGKNLRLKTKEYMERQNIKKKWVPIQKIKTVVTAKQSSEYQIVREQFPIMPAEALTVHKSQGQSMNEVCVDLKNSSYWTREKIYVALSRVTNLAGLYIIGTFNPPKPSSPTSDLSVEISRLQSPAARLKLCYDNLKETSDLKIIYHNVQAMSTSFEQILCDSWYSRADVMIFAETQTISADDYQFPGFNMIFRTDENAINRKQRGIMIFSKPQIKIEIMDHVLRELGTSHIDLVRMKVSDLNIVTGYKSPKTNAGIFMDNLKKTANITNQTLDAVIGDFNFDAYQSNSWIEAKMRTEFKLEQVLPYGVPTTNMNTQIDVIFASKKNNCHAGIYESYFSDHKVLYFVLENLKPEKLNNIVIENPVAINKLKRSKIDLGISQLSDIFASTPETNHQIDISDDEEVQKKVHNASQIMFQIKQTVPDELFLIRIGIIIAANRSYFDEIQCRHVNSEGVLYRTEFQNLTSKTKNNKLESEIQRTHNVINITGNGNCLYNSISFLLHGNESYASELRLLAILMIIEHRNVFDSLILSNAIDFRSEITEIPEAQRLPSLILDIATDTVFGNEGAIAALCIGLERPIVCVMPFFNQRGENSIGGFKCLVNNHSNRPFLIMLTSPGTRLAHYSAICQNPNSDMNRQFDLINLLDFGFGDNSF